MKSYENDDKEVAIVLGDDEAAVFFTSEGVIVSVPQKMRDFVGQPEKMLELFEEKPHLAGFAKLSQEIYGLKMSEAPPEWINPVNLKDTENK